MMENQIMYNGPEGDISMPANTFGNVSTQVCDFPYTLV